MSENKSLGKRLMTPNLMLFVSNWPTAVGPELAATLNKLFNDELLELKNVRAGTVLTRPEAASGERTTSGVPAIPAKPAELAQAQGTSHLTVVLPEFEGRITMKALEAWMTACAVGATALEEVIGPTFLVVEPTTDGKTAVLAWEFANVCPATSGQQDVSFELNKKLDDEPFAQYQVNLLSQVNLDYVDVLKRAQETLNAYNNPLGA